MQIVVNITENHYKALMKMKEFSLGYYQRAIINGTVLPKGHGDLVTKEQMIELVEYYQINPQNFDFVNLIDEIKDEKPIVEADKGE